MAFFRVGSQWENGGNAKKDKPPPWRPSPRMPPRSAVSPGQAAVWPGFPLPPIARAKPSGFETPLHAASVALPPRSFISSGSATSARKSKCSGSLKKSVLCVVRGQEAQVLTFQGSQRGFDVRRWPGMPYIKKTRSLPSPFT